MTTPDGQTPDEPGGAATAGDVDLMTAASRPDLDVPLLVDIPHLGPILFQQDAVDPCDVACDAMPAHIVGDLAPPEENWLRGHTAECNYCANELGRYERLEDTLAHLDELCLEPSPDDRSLAPPRFVVPGRHPTRRATYGRVESPVGPLFVAASDTGLCEIGFAQNEAEAVFRRRLEERGFAPEPVGPAPIAGNHVEPAVDRAARELGEYFGGRRDRFDLPLDWTGLTPFARAVLEATAEVPFGRLSTYREIARRIGKPGATRAVGNALGRNPIPVVVPCHRIVRTGGALGGYTGGLHIKERLLAHEGSVLG